MYSHHCCNLARSPDIALISRVSRESIRFSDWFFPKSNNSSSFVFHPRVRSFSNGCFQRTLANRGLLKSSNSLTRRLPPVYFSSSAEPKGRYGWALPWITAYRGRGKKAAVGIKNGERPSFSSWAESAESYFSRNDGRKLRDERERGHGRRNLGNPDSEEKGVVVEVQEQEEAEEEEIDEPADDPRWDRMKDKYREFISRGSRFEKPEIYRWNKQESWGRRTLKKAAASSVPKMVAHGVYGVGPVLSALTVGRREFYALYVQEGMDLSGNNRKKDKKGVDKVLKVAEKIGLKVIQASKHDLNMVVDNRPHQGLVLDASPLDMIDVRELEPVAEGDQRAHLWLALDEVTDPQNLGAIIRSAYFFGAEGVVLCAKNSAPLSGVVSKASAGSLELIELRSCKNMMKFLTSSIENGWRILGGSVSSRALPLREVEVGVPTILVLGSEGSGLRPLVEKSCTQLIRIPGSMHIDNITGDIEPKVEEMDHNGFGQELKFFLAVESLNVSVAAGRSESELDKAELPDGILTALKYLEEEILQIPNATVHLTGDLDIGAFKLGRGDFAAFRVTDDVPLAIMIKVGEDLRRPLTKDETVVKLGQLHYLFTNWTKTAAS